MKLKDYLPLKAICEDLGVSRWTLWRAARSDIPDFPKPIKVGRQLYWKKTELDALEAALLRFEGRCVFDRKRRHARAAKKQADAMRSSAGRQRQTLSVAAHQRDLFS